MKKTELEYLKLALVDWEKPIEDARYTATYMGFCHYFIWRHDLSVFTDFYEQLPTLYSERRQQGEHHYNQDGDRPEGRAQRVQALKNAISKLEKLNVQK